MSASLSRSPTEFVPSAPSSRRQSVEAGQAGVWLAEALVNADLNAFLLCGGKQATVLFVPSGAYTVSVHADEVPIIQADVRLGRLSRPPRPWLRTSSSA